MAGVSSYDIAVSLQTILSGIEVTDFREEEDIIPIIMRTEEPDRQHIGKLETLDVFAQATGQTVPLKGTGKLIEATALPPPDWMPDHPLHEVSTLQEPSTGGNAAGKVLSWIVQFVVVGLIMNYLGEGLYYRAALQPKLRGVFGKGAWVAAGVGFGLKHLYFWWRVPYLVPVGWALGFLYGPMGSLPLALFFHWLGNTL